MAIRPIELHVKDLVETLQVNPTSPHVKTYIAILGQVRKMLAEASVVPAASTASSTILPTPGAPPVLTAAGAAAAITGHGSLQ